MTPTKQREQFSLLIRSILLQVEMPGPIKLVLSGQIEKRLAAIKENEIGPIIELAFQFCQTGLYRFAELLGWEVGIDVRRGDVIDRTGLQDAKVDTDGLAAGAHGSRGALRDERLGKNGPGKVPAPGLFAPDLRDRLEGRN